MKKILEIKSEIAKFSAPRKLKNNFLDPEIQRISWCQKSEEFSS